jgi:hypothetical protein
VTAMENRIEALESILSKLKTMPNCGQGTTVNMIEFGGHLRASGAANLERFPGQSPKQSCLGAMGAHCTCGVQPLSLIIFGFRLMAFERRINGLQRAKQSSKLQTS